jgi:hypothetical protein
VKRSFKFWLLGLAVLLALGGATPAQACGLPGRPIVRAARFVGRVVTERVRIVRTARPCNRVERAETFWMPRCSAGRSCPVE